jgi:2-haloacid dehalogenase
LNVKPEEALMVTAYRWDLAGAKAAGLQTAFIARLGKALYSLAPKPDYNVKVLAELVDLLK